MVFVRVLSVCACRGEASRKDWSAVEIFRCIHLVQKNTQHFIQGSRLSVNSIKGSGFKGSGFKGSGFKGSGFKGLAGSGGQTRLSRASLEPVNSVIAKLSVEWISICAWSFNILKNITALLTATPLYVYNTCIKWRCFYAKKAHGNHR